MHLQPQGSGKLEGGRSIHQTLSFVHTIHVGEVCVADRCGQTSELSLSAESHKSNGSLRYPGLMR